MRNHNQMDLTYHNSFNADEVIRYKLNNLTYIEHVHDSLANLIIHYILNYQTYVIEILDET